MVGKSLRNVTHFHGYKTNRKFESLTDKILLQFCYRSETFSGRNIQIKYRAVGKLEQTVVKNTKMLPV